MKASGSGRYMGQRKLVMVLTKQRIFLASPGLRERERKRETERDDVCEREKENEGGERLGVPTYL